MRIILGLLVVVGCYLALVSAEECTLNGDCTTTACTGSGQEVVCQHPDDGGITENGGLCTCSSSSSACVTREDCLSPAHEELDCDDDRRHCYDSACICSRWPGQGR